LFHRLPPTGLANKKKYSIEHQFVLHEAKVPEKDALKAEGQPQIPDHHDFSMMAGDPWRNR
jgi:hypothetical protein